MEKKIFRNQTDTLIVLIEREKGRIQNITLIERSISGTFKNYLLQSCKEYLPTLKRYPGTEDLIKLHLITNVKDVKLK